MREGQQKTYTKPCDKHVYICTHANARGRTVLKIAHVPSLSLTVLDHSQTVVLQLLLVVGVRLIATCCFSQIASYICLLVTPLPGSCDKLWPQRSNSQVAWTAELKIRQLSRRWVNKWSWNPISHSGLYEPQVWWGHDKRLLASEASIDRSTNSRGWWGR